MRRHYMTLYTRGTVEITYIKKPNGIEVTFEETVNGGFNTLVLSLDGRIIYNEGFNNSDIDYFRRFLRNNSGCILEEVSEGLNV